MLVIVASLACGSTAFAAVQGDANAGDVWVDNVGQPPGPGHEMDPHLACQDINLWGSGLADTSGTFTIDGWPPSGSKAQAYATTWSYQHDPTRKSGSQVVAVIDVQTLIAQAAANGDTPAAQGYHFKLEFSQDPQKHKTFWVNCPPPSPPSGPGGGSLQGSAQNTSTTTTSVTSNTVNTLSPASSSVSGFGTGKPMRKHHRANRHARLHKPVRHHRARHRSATQRKVSSATFTG
jgi:hypothetical protein